MNKSDEVPELCKAAVECEAGKLRIKDSWVLCPVCRRKKVLRLLPGTRARNLAVYCRSCKTESVVDILT
ncbi:cysteine-rich KTR domain-containing protein [Oscillospiraceae bacterium 38-13]